MPMAGIGELGSNFGGANDPTTELRTWSGRPQLWSAFIEGRF
jgi:hypothetical protein